MGYESMKHRRPDRFGRKPTITSHYTLTEENLREMSDRTGAPIKELQELLDEANETAIPVKIRIVESWDG